MSYRDRSSRNGQPNKRLNNEELIANQLKLLETMPPISMVLGSLQNLDEPTDEHHVPRRVYEALKTNSIFTLNKVHAYEQLRQEFFVEKVRELLFIEEAEQACDVRRTDVDNLRFGAIYSRKNDRELLYYLSDTIPARKMATIEIEERVLIRSRPTLHNTKPRQYLGKYKPDWQRIIYTPPKGVKANIRRRGRRKKKSVGEHIHFDLSLSYDVFVLPNRVTFEFEHRALDLFDEKADILFPEKHKIYALDDNNNEYSDTELDIDEDKFNESQRQAIKNIVKGACKPAPYILFGPPGTGKTTTIIEAVKQIYKSRSSTRILICTGSNACADMIADKLKNSESIDSLHVIRLSASNRRDKVAEIEDDRDSSFDSRVMTKDVLDHLMVREEPVNDESATESESSSVEESEDEEDQAVVIDDDVLERLKPITSLEMKRIVVSTCVNVGSIRDDIRFDYVFLDEAGQVHEGDSLITIRSLSHSGLFVICGDPYQLGPVLKSQSAEKLGLGVPLIERLFKNVNYSTSDERFITQLNISYRCDPRVLSVSNKLFYKNSLKCVNKTPEDLLQMLKVKHPLIIHSTEGKNSQEQGETSWYNLKEAKICAEYAQKLYSFGIEAKQIGIISPYKKQISHLFKVFKDNRIEAPQISTVEKFQGDERDIIIISTVKSYDGFMSPRFAERQFIFNPKRFNVAISRARHIVIVVGDVRYLEQNPNWKQFLSQAEHVGDGPKSSANQAAELINDNDVLERLLRLEI